jgi:hypothetical protein
VSRLFPLPIIRSYVHFDKKTRLSNAVLQFSHTSYGSAMQKAVVHEDRLPIISQPGDDAKVSRGRSSLEESARRVSLQ